MYMVLKCEIAFIFRVESMNSSIGSYKNHAFNPYVSMNESGISEIEDITYMPVIKTLVEKNFKTHSKFYVNFLTFSLARSLYDIHFYASLLFLIFKIPKKKFLIIRKKCNFLKIKNWEDFNIRYWCNFMPDSLKAGTVGYFLFSF